MSYKKTKIHFSELDWGALEGGSAEVKWLADRDRKHGKALTFAQSIKATFEELRARDAVFRPSPRILVEVPFSVVWYVSLAGFSQKTLSNIDDGPKKFGMKLKASTLVKKFTNGGVGINKLGSKAEQKNAKDAEAFCNWIIDEIEQKFSVSNQNPDTALILVALILGGRVIGQGQNEGGDDAVLLVKELLVRALAPKHDVEVRMSGTAEWEELDSAPNLAEASAIRFDGLLNCDFTSGGNRPDIKIILNDQVLAVGEIKGRKDLSNVWESWMPQVVGHMKTWTGEFPEAARLFFGTLISSSMIDGESIKGTKHTGLRELFHAGQLTSAFNVSKTVAGDRSAEEAWGRFAGQLSEMITSMPKN